jgi:hypothetical protein
MRRSVVIPASTRSIAPHPLVALSICQEFVSAIETSGASRVDPWLTTNSRAVVLDLSFTVLFRDQSE